MVRCSGPLPKLEFARVHALRRANPAQALNRNRTEPHIGKVYNVKRLTLPLLLLASSTAAFAATPLSGTYSMHTSVAGNETDGSCTFAVKETAITGSCKGPDGKEIPLTGTVDGNKATWKFDIDFNGTTLTLVHTGTVDDAGKVTGTVEVQPFGVSGEFSGTPAAATAAAPAAAPAAEPTREGAKRPQPRDRASLLPPAPFPSKMRPSLCRCRSLSAPQHSGRRS